MSFTFSLSSIKFEDIREEIKTWFIEKGIDYSTGSNFSNLVDILAYISLLQSYQLNSSMNEQYLDSCLTRKSAVKIAKSLFYRPKRKISAKINGTLKYKGIYSGSSSSFIVDKVVFSGSKTGYDFIAEEVNFTKNSDGYFYGNFIAAEEVEKNINFLGDGEENQSFLIENENVSEREFDIRQVGNVQDPNIWKDFSLLGTIIGTNGVPNSTSLIYFVEEDLENEYYTKISFGNGIIGQKPSTTEQIKITYYETHGSLGNDENAITIKNLTINDSNVNSSLANFIVTTNSNAYGGRDNETLTEIKKHASKNFVSGLKGVTKEDYLNLIENIDNTVKYVDVVGGDEFTLDNYLHVGHVFLMIVPNAIRQELDASEKSTSFPISEIFNLTTSEYSGSTINNENPLPTDFLSEIKKNTVVSTYRKVISPSYLYIDLQPYIELKDKYLSFNNVSEEIYDELVGFVEENIMGTTKKYRQDRLLELMDSNEFVLSSKMESEFFILTNDSNILDTYLITLPYDFVKTNNDQYNEDKKFNNQDYDYENMPIERRTIFGDFGKDEASGFSRYLINDNFVNVEDKTLMTELYFNHTSNSNFELNNSLSYTRKIVSDKNTYNVEIFHQNDFNVVEDDAIEIQSLIGTGNGYSIPLKFTGDILNYSGSSSGYYKPNDYEQGTSNGEVKDRWFVYIVNNNIRILAAEILQVNVFGNEYFFTSRKIIDGTFIDPVLEEINIQKKQDEIDNYFYYTSETVIKQNDNSKNDCKIKMYYSQGSSKIESNQEIVKLISRKKIGKILLDADFNIDFEIDTDSTVTDYFEYSKGSNYIEIKCTDEENSLVKILKKSNEFSIDSTSLNQYKVGFPYDQYKDFAFEIIEENNENYLYAFETISDTTLGIHNKETHKLEFNSTVYFLPNLNESENTYISLESLFEDYNIFQKNDYDRKISKIRLLPKVEYNSNGDIAGQKTDFNAQFGICILPNVKKPKEKIILGA